MENQVNQSELCEQRQTISTSVTSMPMTCVALYYRGKHRGEVCGKPVSDHEKKLCERHSKCKIANSGLKPIQCTAHLRSGDQCPAMGYYHNSLVCPRHHYKSINLRETSVTTKVDEQTKSLDLEDH